MNYLCGDESNNAIIQQNIYYVKNNCKGMLVLILLWRTILQNLTQNYVR